MTFIDSDFCDPECWEHNAAGLASIWEAWSGERIARVSLTHPPDESNEALWVALHELGHLSDHRKPNGGWRITTRTRRTLDQEARAWEYALRHWPDPLTPGDWHEIWWRLKTYHDHKPLRRTAAFERLFAEADRSRHGAQVL